MRDDSIPANSRGATRIAFLMQVHPDQHEEYYRRHNPIWLELESVLKLHGAQNYSIFLHAESSQLFAYLEVEDKEKWKSIAETEVCKRWWAHMRDVMPSNKDNSPKSEEMIEMFHLG